MGPGAQMFKREGKRDFWVFFSDEGRGERQAENVTLEEMRWRVCLRGCGSPQHGSGRAGSPQRLPLEGRRPLPFKSFSPCKGWDLVA